jgi:hypothetical protein
MTGQPWQFCGSIEHTGPAEILSKAGNGKFRLVADGGLLHLLKVGIWDRWDRPTGLVKTGNGHHTKINWQMLWAGNKRTLGS